MDTLLKLKAEELNMTLIDFIKTSFKGKKIAVHIYEDEMDETEYLMSDPIAKQHLLESIENVKEGKNMKVYTIDEINEMFLNEPEP